MHKTSGLRDPAAAFPLPRHRDDTQDRRQANWAVAVSALGLAATGLIELLLAVVTGSVGLLADAIHNLSDVSTSAVVFLGFRLSRRPPTERYPYGLERSEDLAGVGIAVVIWVSAAFAGTESIRKFLEHGQTAHVGAGIVGALIGVAGARARWTGRTLRVEIEGWVDPDLPVRDADALGRQVASSLARQLPEASSLTWTVRAGPA
jgi:divalent metal cation (Fe/Co/Zn/Cd) transporter